MNLNQSQKGENMKHTIIATLIAMTSATAYAAPVPSFDTMSWQETSEAAIHAFTNNFDPDNAQKAASACGNVVRAAWNKQGSYSTVFNVPQFENFKVEVFSNNTEAGCKVTAK